MGENASNFLLNFKSLFNEILDLKKYILIYLFFLILTILCNFSGENYLSPFKELFIIFIAFILGIIAILYYSRNKKSLHKVAFVIIILFGILSLFTSPIFDIADEEEHYVRSDLLSRGQIIPEYNDGFNISKSQYELINLNFKNITGPETGKYSIEADYHKTIFDTDLDNKKIDYTQEKTHSAFIQNPFYGYIAQAIGILIAKLLDLTVIWTLWLGRLFNLILFGALASFAIKKSPIFKMPILIIACMPIAIYQGASVSIDGLIIGLGLIVIAYFFKMIKSREKTITIKDIAIFTMLCVLLGLMKLPLIAIILLILFIPKSKFKNEKYYYFGFLSVLILAIIAILWSNFYAVDSLKMSWRGSYFYDNNISESLQINHMLNNPLESLVMFLKIPNELVNIPNTIFLPTLATPECNFILMGYLFSIFLVMIFLFYPNKSKFSIKSRLGVLIISLIIIIGTYLIQYLTWSPVGSLIFSGISIRYFIPLFALVPFIFNINKEIRVKNLDLIIITLVISCIGSFISMIGIYYY